MVLFCSQLSEILSYLANTKVLVEILSFSQKSNTLMHNLHIGRYAIVF